MEEWERSVWSRVMETGREAAFPRELLREAQLLAEEFKTLGLPRLYALQKEAVALLRGICSLSGEKPGMGKRLAPAGGSREKRLRSCFHRCRRLMGEYAARGGQPETGLLYSRLEGIAREQCILLAGLLGKGR